MNSQHDISMCTSLYESFDCSYRRVRIKIFEETYIITLTEVILIFRNLIGTVTKSYSAVVIK